MFGMVFLSVDMSWPRLRQGRNQDSKRCDDAGISGVFRFYANRKSSKSRALAHVEKIAHSLAVRLSGATGRQSFKFLRFDSSRD